MSNDIISIINTGQKMFFLIIIELYLINHGECIEQNSTYIRELDVNNKSVVNVTLGSVCVHQENCSSLGGSSCILGECKCNIGYMFDVISNSCNLYNCNIDENCAMFPNTVCFEGNCTCEIRSGYSDLVGQCRKTCSFDGLCAGNEFCFDSKCVCTRNHLYNWYLLYEDNHYIVVYTCQNFECKSNRECREWNNTYCDNGSCVCSSPYSENLINGTCELNENPKLINVNYPLIFTPLILIIFVIIYIAYFKPYKRCLNNNKHGEMQHLLSNERQTNMDNSNVTMNKIAQVSAQIAYTSVIAFHSLARNPFEKDLFNKLNNTFEVIEQIGSGTFGIVYKVKDKCDSQHYALKVLHFDTYVCYSQSEQEPKNILKEINMMKKHKNIVRCFGLLPDSMIIKMELCHFSLEKLFSEKNPPPIIIHPVDFLISSEIFSEILEGVNYLHEHKPQIIHRDLKPGNILINMNGIPSNSFVKICDFGLAKYHNEEYQSHSRGKGTNRYMAPEVWDSSKYNTKADIYSLGILAQMIFEIKIDSSGNKNSTFPGSKFYKITELVDIRPDYITNLSVFITRMIKDSRDERPSCSEILEAKNTWTFTSSEIIARIVQDGIPDYVHLETLKNTKDLYENFLSFKKTVILKA